MKKLMILIFIALIVNEISGRSNPFIREDVPIASPEDGNGDIHTNPGQLLPPDSERSVSQKKQIQLVSPLGINAESINTFSPQAIEESRDLPEVNLVRALSIRQKCLESHQGFIIFPDEPRPIICDPSTTSTTVRTTSHQDYDPSKNEVISSTAGPETSTGANFEACMYSCQIRAVNSPVCGTDFVTYFNFDHITCARKCGTDVLLQYNGPCTSSTSLPITTTPIAPISSTQNPLAFAQCMVSCPVTPEYYPVCGSDFTTYSNPSKLFCTNKCGKSVKEMRKGRCPSRGTTTVGPTPSTTIMTTTRGPLTTTKISPQVKKCISQCPVTSEYNPVCGTNFVTYTNPGRMKCVRSCGVDVRVLSQGRCAGSS